MDELSFFLLLLFAFLLFFGIPILMSVLLYKYFKKKNYDQRFKVFVLTPIFFLIYLIYVSIFPTNSFYQEDFKEITGVELPDGARIGYKTATFPDHFGDYSSESVINVGKDFYNSLPDILCEKGLFENQPIHTKEFDKALDSVNGLEIERSFSMFKEGGITYYVGFLSDQETVIVQRTSW